MKFHTSARRRALHGGLFNVKLGLVSATRMLKLSFLVSSVGRCFYGVAVANPYTSVVPVVGALFIGRGRR